MNFRELLRYGGPIVKEAARHVLRRPVVGVVAAPYTTDGRWVLIRRVDTGTWALPGGTVEWGETLRGSLARELREEAGISALRNIELVGTYSDPMRDTRFHAVTIAVRCEVEAPTQARHNPLEVSEVRLFTKDEIPEDWAYNMRDIFEAALAKKAPVFE